jgi:hypothetical protein
MKKPTQYQPRPFPSWRNVAKNSALFITVGSLLMIQSACGGEEYETIAVTDTIRSVELTKGIVSIIKENAKGQFLVEEEKVVDNKSDSRVIIKYLDGRIDTMTLDRVKSLVTAADSAAIRDTALHATNSDPKNKTVAYAQGYSPSMHTLGYVLLGSAVGYYLGKSLFMPPNPNIYRYPQQQYYSGYNMGNPPNYSGGSGGYSSSSSYRSSGSTYNYGSGSNPNSPYAAVKASAKPTVSYRTSYKTVSRPSRGFFGGSRSSSSGRSGWGG